MDAAIAKTVTILDQLEVVGIPLHGVTDGSYV